MDTLTHGLLGAATAVLPLPRWLLGSDRTPEQARLAMRAAVLACVLAAELPDLDYLLPAADPVLQTLRAHRGLTHALVAVPVVALIAAAIAKAVFRHARLRPLYARALIAVPLAHLLPDLWTGWGTRLLLPFSERRLALDWTMVVDPIFTLPLLAAALWSIFRREHLRRAFAVGLAVSSLYLAMRIASAEHLATVVRATYPDAATVHVFPAPLAVTRWRYVARFPDAYAVGSVTLGDIPREEARVDPFPTGPLPAELESVPTVREALAWARFPVVRRDVTATSEQRVEIADLRYHLGGQPTLAFVLTILPDGSVAQARLERGGSVRDLVRRWRQS